MLELLWLIPAFPLAGFLILALVGKRLSRRVVAWIAVGSVGLSTLLAFWIAIGFLLHPPPENAFRQELWTWIPLGEFSPKVEFYLDPLAVVMTLVVTFVSLLIHLYSTEFMIGDEGYSRFFAYMNLFVSSMLVLVLAGNLLLLYLGWEGVGLCSYLLIGFWYRDPANGRAARKAFIVTRVGDTALAIGLFLLFTQLGTLNIEELLRRSIGHWAIGNPMAVAAAALLLGGAVGKSAQLPLQTWLPDAMAGPSPVSALIHAATMVTAGVYLIARMHVIFLLAPAVQTIVGAIGAITLLLAAFSALAQYDLKRILAYSTISQIGYMFLALGVGAWSAAIFHFMTHAFFKALLFLAAGVVIVAMHEEHNIFKMGGLRRQLPLTFWTFLAGSASLAAVPLLTAGFYSKDMILASSLQSPAGGWWFWAAGVAGAFLTALYSFRMVFVAFFGRPHGNVAHRPGLPMQIPLVVLAVLAVVAGFVELPGYLGHVTLFSDFLAPTFSKTPVTHGDLPFELLTPIAAGAVALLGIGLAYYFFLRNPRSVEALSRSGWAGVLHRFWYVGWGFDWLYDNLLVRPYVALARSNRDDAVDSLFEATADLTKAAHHLLSETQNGRLRWYAGGLALGAVLLVAILVLL
jgi:NADH-quinone oxidoreductase subunit L